MTVHDAAEQAIPGVRPQQVNKIIKLIINLVLD